MKNFKLKKLYLDFFQGIIAIRNIIANEIETEKINK